jgi:small-conductance mechanosensitive channel
MDIQQEIYLQLVDRFKEHEIELAFPSQTLYLRDDGLNLDQLSQLRAAPPAPSQTPAG